jgi:hypothetical protein
MQFGGQQVQARGLGEGERWVDGAGVASTNPVSLIGKVVAAKGYGKGIVTKHNRKTGRPDTWTIDFGLNGGHDYIDVKLMRWRTVRPECRRAFSASCLELLLPGGLRAHGGHPLLCTLTSGVALCRVVRVSSS